MLSPGKYLHLKSLGEWTRSTERTDLRTLPSGLKLWSEAAQLNLAAGKWNCGCVTITHPHSRGGGKGESHMFHSWVFLQPKGCARSLLTVFSSSPFTAGRERWPRRPDSSDWRRLHQRLTSSSSSSSSCGSLCPPRPPADISSLFSLWSKLRRKTEKQGGPSLMDAPATVCHVGAGACRWRRSLELFLCGQPCEFRTFYAGFLSAVGVANG